MTRSRWAVVAILVTFTLPGVIASGMASCAATPTIPPLRSFESAKDIDVVCLQVFTTSENNQVPQVPVIPPVPVDQQLCAPVAINQVGYLLPYHLFALVTQTARGEVAVVDLTAGRIIDEDPSTPGNNFLPVGANPAGIAAAPNGAMTFVTSADPTKPAIYGLPSVSILGAAVASDSGITTVYGGADAQAPTLLSWPACSLPSIPGPIIAIPEGPLPQGSGQTTGLESQGYVLAVVLPGDGQTQVARVVTIDPRPLLRGGGIDIGPGPTVPPGSLARCPIVAETPLSGRYSNPSTLGPSWDDGVKYVIDGGPPPGSMKASKEGFVGPSPIPVPQFLCADGGVAGGIDSGTLPPPLTPALPQATAAVRAGTYLYVGDQSLPIIHVIDLSNPLAPKEIAPLAATSALEPKRRVIVSGLAVSPFTRDFKRYLYALDQQDNPASIIVYDVTDPVQSPHVPLTRPHSVLTPQYPVDRIQFTAPVAAVAFAAHDFPLTQNPENGANIVGAAASGLLCNPNPLVDLDAAAFTLPDGEIVDAAFSDGGAGAFYRNNFLVQQVGLGPSRLRGIFGFATLTNGDVMLIDLDDWDAPCRRPVGMTTFTSDIAPPEQHTPAVEDGGPLNPLFPYQVPEAGSTNGIYWVSNELFFPVSQPHRPRSAYPLDDDPLLGIHYPELMVPPELVNIATMAGVGSDAGEPLLLAPDSGRLANPLAAEAGPNVELAWEDPLVAQAQQWTVTYEGTLLQGLVAAINDPAGNFETLELDVQSGQVCEKGIEDFAVSQERVAAIKSAAPAGVLFPSAFDPDKWVGDYVQVADNLPAESSAYWAEPNSCWDDESGHTVVTSPDQRYNLCASYFQPTLNGTAQEQTVVQSITRDFPILEAYDDHLIISRFNYPIDDTKGTDQDAAALNVPQATTNRWVTAPDPSNAPFLRTLKCCFSSHASFNVRAGGEWVALGSVSGLLHHVVTDSSNRCVLSCDPQDALLNARNVGFFPPSGLNIDRNSVLAMRNPMLSYYITHPLGPWPTLAPTDTRYQASCSAFEHGICDVQRVERDLSWQFAIENPFSNQLVTLASNGAQVSPQSMLFIPSLGQLAVVDGAQEGLVIIDLGTVAVSGTPFF